MFGEDVAVPGGVVARLWGHTGGWTRFQARRGCQRLFDLDERLFDAALLRLGERQFAFFLNQHRIIADGWSALVANPLPTEATVNRNTPARKTLRRPIRSPSLPATSRKLP